MRKKNPAALPAPEELVVLLRLKHRETGMSLASMAKAAGLHPNSFNRLFDDSWRPRLDTLSKIRVWLDNGKTPRPDALAELPLAGEGWRILHDRDGWWVCTDDGAAIGAFALLRNAVHAARNLEQEASAAQ